MRKINSGSNLVVHPELNNELNNESKEIKSISFLYF